jgi:hypothetical protein
LKHGYTFATITIVGNDVPIILGIEGVKEHSDWEPAETPADSKADVVTRLLSRAQQYVDLDEVLLDRGFYARNVRAEINSRGLLYTMPVGKYESDYKAIKRIKSKDGVDAAVNHDVPVGIVRKRSYGHGVRRSLNERGSAERDRSTPERGRY